MKKFLEDLKKELNKYSIVEEEVQDILDDHEDMIREAINDGLKVEDLSVKFGNPKMLAAELAKSSKKKTSTTKETDYTLINTFYNVELKSVLLSTIADNIIVETHDEENIQIFMKNIKDPDDYEITCNDVELKLAYKKYTTKFIFTKNKSGSILVKLPQKLDLKEGNISLVSGDCVFGNVDAKEFNFSSTSGDLKLSNVACDKLYIKTVSGDAIIENIKTDNAKFTAVSGNYEINNTSIKSDLDINTVSGDYKFLNAECDKLFISSVSGDINGEDFYPIEVTFKSVSGDLKIDNKDKERKVRIARKKTLSGDIKIK